MKRLALMLALSGQPLFAETAALSAINDTRAAHGLAKLDWHAALETAARRHAQDLVRSNRFSHAGLDGSDVLARVTMAGFRACFAAENIAKGQSSLVEVMESWMGSRGHRRNILSKRAKFVSLVRAKDDVWVMVLAAGC